MSDLIYISQGDFLTLFLAIAMYLIIFGRPRWSEWRRESHIRKEIKALSKDLDTMTKDIV